MEVLGLIVDEIDAKRAQNPGSRTSSSSNQSQPGLGEGQLGTFQCLNVENSLPAVDHSSHTLYKGQDREAA